MSKDLEREREYTKVCSNSRIIAIIKLKYYSASKAPFDRNYNPDYCEIIIKIPNRTKVTLCFWEYFPTKYTTRLTLTIDEMGRQQSKCRTSTPKPT